MAMHILWPNLPARLVPVATEAVGSGFELDFYEKFEDVSDEQWANAETCRDLVEDAQAALGMNATQYDTARRRMVRD